MARTSFRTVGTQTTESSGQLLGKINRERALRRLFLKYKDPFKTFTHPNTHTKFTFANKPTGMSAERLPLVKLKEGGLTVTHNAKKCKYHSMAEYNNMRINARNYLHYRSQYEHCETNNKEGLPVLKDQSTNTYTLMLRPYASSPTHHPKTVALVGMPLVHAEKSHTPRMAKSAGMVVRKEKISPPHSYRPDTRSDQENLHTYRLLGSGCKRKDEHSTHEDTDGVNPKPVANKDTNPDKLPKTVMVRPGIHVTPDRRNFNARYIRSYTGSETG